jgi:hypothetical protein
MGNLLRTEADRSQLCHWRRALSKNRLHTIKTANPTEPRPLESGYGGRMLPADAGGRRRRQIMRPVREARATTVRHSAFAMHGTQSASAVGQALSRHSAHGRPQPASKHVSQRRRRRFSSLVYFGIGTAKPEAFVAYRRGRLKAGLQARLPAPRKGQNRRTFSIRQECPRCEDGAGVGVHRKKPRLPLPPLRSPRVLISSLRLRVSAVIEQG